LEVPEMIRCVLCMPEGVEGRVCSLEVLEVIRCVLLCMLAAVDGGFCLLEVPKVKCCVLGTLDAGGCGG